jgi:hypothetical protein
LKNITYKWLMSSVQLSHLIITQNIRLFYSFVCKQSKCKQTLYSLNRWFKV